MHFEKDIFRQFLLILEKIEFDIKENNEWYHLVIKFLCCRDKILQSRID